MSFRRNRLFVVCCVAAMFAGYGLLPGYGQTASVPAGTGEQMTQAVEGEIVGDHVSIRSNDTREATILALAFKGDRVQVLARLPEWYVVQLPRDYTMWISKEFVAVGPNKEAVVTGDGLRVRQGPGPEYQAVGTMNRGRRVEVIDEKEGWLQFRFASGDRGYVARQYVRLAGDLAPRPPEPVPNTEIKPLPENPEPEKVGPETEPDGKVMEIFNKAEDVYRREVQKKEIADWQLDEAHTLYASVMEKTRNQSLLGKCRSRIAVIALAGRYREAAKHAPVDPREQLAEREKQIEEEFARKREKLAEEIRQLYPTCIAIGRLEKLASTWLQPATHKLVKDERVTHLLYSDTVNLSVYEGKFVGIEGETISSVKWAIPAVKVTGVVLAPEKKEVEEKPVKEEEGADEEKTGTP